ncbi:DUF3658 domain-containing protein [Phreatobacter sp. AB_2022a]|uniref:DUF3658 domain-containing protein n=1 Tax=Phreatobacter sp. AB_2022a TaxID=3003134 RepID=UPI00228744B8|nr:DUF3658 domain-containing protein [Phreatobacter sp. AB_2022a]MCZ0732719.1 DUF3658 domain-containing protein [Phreatobacter sp. AB_2022a]
MKTLHIAPNCSAAGTLRRVLRVARRDDDVLAYRDDLSCGPIAAGSPDVRAAWWRQFTDWPEAESQFRSFWDDATASADRLIVWFSRWSAQELAFRLAWSSQMRDRPYHVIDVAGHRVPLRRPDGSVVQSRPLIATSIAPDDGWATLLDSEQPVSMQEDVLHREVWARLEAENAPFRVVTPTGLASAPLDHFDRILLELARPDWKSMSSIVGHGLAASLEPYLQVGELMLRARLVALVTNGALVADGDPRDMRTCRIRLR